MCHFKNDVDLVPMSHLKMKKGTTLGLTYHIEMEEFKDVRKMFYRLKQEGLFTYYAIREEVGNKGNKYHLQGYAKLAKDATFEEVRALTGASDISVGAPIEALEEYIRNPRKEQQFESVTGRRPRELRNGPIPIPFMGQGILSPSKLYTWQQDVVEMVNEPVSDRKIYWYVDTKGGSGKTALLKFLNYYHGCAYTTGGQTSDIAFAVKDELESTRCVIVDYPRGMDMSEVNYDLIEKFKDGLMTFTKYKSGNKTFEPKHVIVFSNSEPDLSKLSMDRWVVRHLKDKKIVKEDLITSSPKRKWSNKEWLESMDVPTAEEHAECMKKRRVILSADESGLSDIPTDALIEEMNK